jgi:hypothetical protein
MSVLFVASALLMWRTMRKPEVVSIAQPNAVPPRKEGL